MNAPVTGALAGPRPAAPRASDTGSARSAAPFASTLDGVLAENRASDRGVERRSSREERADRAAERATAKEQRGEDRAGAAERRATDKADRIEDREARAAGKDAGADATPLAREATPPAGDGGSEETGASAEAPRGGLPALWALLMGSSLASTAPAEGATTDATDAPGGVTALDPAALGAPAAGLAEAVATAAVATTPVPATTAAAAAAATAADIDGAAVPAPAPPALGSAGLAAGPPADGDPLDAAAGPAPSVVPAPSVAAATPAAGAAATAESVLPLDVVLAAAPAVAPTAPTAGQAVAVPVPPVVPMGEAAPTTTAPPAAADAVAVPAVATPGQSLSDGAGQDNPDGAPPSAPAPAQATAAPAVAPVSYAAAAANVDGATGSAATLPVGSQVARQVAVLSGGPDGNHSMTLVLTPETLGKVQVQVTLSKGSIELALRGAHEHGRAALLDALPELRRELEAAGLNPSRLEVARDTGGSWLDRQPTPQQGFGERGGQHDRGENRSRPWGRPADIGGSGPSLNPNRSTSSGVDVLV
jgi:flagellar hook-length control protein FliK